jgi:hypothetical protein
MIQLHIAQMVINSFLSIDVTWESVPVLLQEEHAEIMYNTTIEHYPFQKGFMFGIYWENQEMGASVGTFSFFHHKTNSTPFGKSINI